ncbi:hypothetical protein DPMN_010668 [Dreissena polymorpha]|uniref:Uncharacterized protein n=1 Tax=Dreissena polymorpha TaxID=45954 RepID=A0A9D4N1X5_DREPO|nr:hypothetical protein DPMN_010668 [Dreissena polymorpha]
MEKETWQRIAEEIPAQDKAVKTAEKCSNKWYNLKSEIKAAVTNEKTRKRKTCRGPLSDAAMAVDQRVITAELYEDSAFFQDDTAICICNENI